MSKRMTRAMIAVVMAVGLSAMPARALSQGLPEVDPADTRLVPSPIETSDPGTTWACRLTGTGAQCAGSLTVTWPEVEGPGDWCSVPLISVDGTFTRTQTRYYAHDGATGDYLEYKRLIHLDSEENLTPTRLPPTSSSHASP